MKIVTDPGRIDEIFTRGSIVEAFPSKEELRNRLLSGRRLRMYIGFDPTATALHLGHARNLMVLEEFRKLGHEVIVLFGDFTARIGDPTDKTAARKQLTADEIRMNVADWLKQIKPLMDFGDKTNPPLVKYNSEWLAKLSFAEGLEISSNFTVQQMLGRDMFEKRMKEKAPIHLHEFMYPLMQGYDSVAMEVDAELCGTDQIFNALAGRTLLKRLKNKDKFVIAINLIANPVTGEMMSKSNGTGVFIDLSANELFGAVMAQPDPMIEPLFLHLTKIPLSEKDSIMALGPRVAKAKIAFDIVRRFHGEESARLAEESFEKTFAKGGIPENIQEVNLKKGESLSESLIQAGVVPSKTEWRRLIDGSAVRDENDEKISDPNFAPTKTTVLKIGKRRFVKVIV